MPAPLFPAGVPLGEAALAVLATWRVAHALARERGPFDAFSRLHVAAGRVGLARALACPLCLGLWLSGVPAAVLAPGWGAGVLLWLAIAGGAAALERALPAPVDD